MSMWGLVSSGMDIFFCKFMFSDKGNNAIIGK